jgi:hypothetical protein
MQEVREKEGGLRRALRRHTRAGSEAPPTGVGIRSNAISHARVSAIVGGLTDSCVRQRQRRWS